ncbi:MAG: UDP-3-O-(3-hydroxymyristoyl)glucosamine N-acyltransferase, partial [Pseudomonadota bacterium]
SGPFTLHHIGEKLQAQTRTPKDTDPDTVLIHYPATLSQGGAGAIGFLANPKYRDDLRTTQCQAIIIGANDLENLPSGVCAIISEHVYRDFCKVTQLFYQDVERHVIKGPHVIDSSARIAETAQISAGAVIGAGCVIGEDCVIGANAVIDHGVSIGAHTIVGPGSSLAYCRVGENCLIHAGVRLGTRGFGFDMSGDHYEDFAHGGLVRIGNAVEIGANTTIDRGALNDTVIGNHCRINNLSQISHGVVMGEGCVVAGQCAIAGSTTLQDRVVMGGLSAIAGHLIIGAGAMINASSLVIHNLPAGSRYMGTPALPVREFFRNLAWVRKNASRKED